MPSLRIGCLHNSPIASGLGTRSAAPLLMSACPLWHVQKPEIGIVQPRNHPLHLGGKPTGILGRGALVGMRYVRHTGKKISGGAKISKQRLEARFHCSDVKQPVIGLRWKVQKACLQVEMRIKLHAVMFEFAQKCGKGQMRMDGKVTDLNARPPERSGKKPCQLSLQVKIPSELLGIAVEFVKLGRINPLIRIANDRKGLVPRIGRDSWPDILWPALQKLQPITCKLA